MKTTPPSINGKAPSPKPPTSQKPVTRSKRPAQPAAPVIPRDPVGEQKAYRLFLALSFVVATGWGALIASSYLDLTWPPMLLWTVGVAGSIVLSIAWFISANQFVRFSGRSPVNLVLLASNLLWILFTLCFIPFLLAGGFPE